MSRLRRTGRSIRLMIAAVLASLSLVVATSCTPDGPPAQGGIGVELGPLTVPLPPIEVRAPGVNIPLLVCEIGYRPPGVEVRGATVTVPRVRIDPGTVRATVSNVTVRIPQLRIPLSTLTLSCLGVSVPVQVDLIVPSTVIVQNATVDLVNRTISLSNPSFTLNGAGIGVNGLDLVLPLPPIVNIPLPSFGIPF